MSQVSKPQVIFVLGCTGAGKGTQCAYIAREYGFVHISVGDLLIRELKRADSQYGPLIDRHTQDGGIVPFEVTCQLIESAMRNAHTDKFVIDGFPRNKDNVNGWIKLMESKVDLRCVLYLECDEDQCVYRCINRKWEDIDRPDDNAYSIREKIKTFYTNSLPIVEFYKSHGLLKTINAAKTEVEVFSDIKDIIDQM